MGRGALLLLAVAAAAWAKPETTRHATEDGSISIALPAAWKVGPAGGKAALSLSAEIPGDGVVKVAVHQVDGPLLTARAQAMYELEPAKKTWRTEKVRYVAMPLPHLFMERGDEVVLLTFVRRLCRGLNVEFRCSRKLFDKVRPALFEAGASVRTTLGRWPVPPALREGYKRSEKGGLVFLVSPEVDPRDARAVQRALVDVQKRVEKRLGKIERPADEPAIVYVHAGRVDVKHLDPNVALSSDGNGADAPARLLFASPFADERDAAHLDLIHEAWRLFFREAYGDMEPEWVYVGERVLFRNEVICGKKAPAVPPSFIDDFKGIRHPLHRLAALREAPESERRLNDYQRRDAEWARWLTYRTHATVFCMFFRHGPAKYRKVYETFLAHMRETGDVKDASRHFHQFDPDDLRDEVAAWVGRKLQVVER